MRREHRVLPLIIFVGLGLGSILTLGGLIINAQANPNLADEARCVRILERLQALISRQQNVAAQHSNLYQQVIDAATEVAEGSLVPKIKADEVNVELALVTTQFDEYKAAVVQLDQSWETVLEGFCEKDRLDAVAEITDARAQLFQLRSRTQQLNRLINSQLHPKLVSIIYPNGKQK